MYHALILSESQKTVDSSNLIQVPLLYPQMFFFLQLFCVEIHVDLFVFLHHPKQKDWEFLLQKSLRFHSTPYDDKCVSSHHGVSPIFRPGGSKVPNPNLRHNAVQLGTRRLTRTPWTTQPELEDLRQQHNAEEKGWWCFFHSSQQKFKKNEKMLGILIWQNWILVVKMWML